MFVSYAAPYHGTRCLLLAVSLQRRCTLSPNELLTVPEAGTRTLYDSLERSARLFPTQKALGWRDTLKVHDVEKEVSKQVDGQEVKEKKTWKYFELSVSRPRLC